MGRQVAASRVTTPPPTKEPTGQCPTPPTCRMVKFQSRCLVVDGWERGMVWVLSRAPSVCLGCLACWCVRVCVRVAAWACACVCACVCVLMCVYGASRWCGLRGPLHLCVYCRCRFPHPTARRRPLLLALLLYTAAAPAAATAAVPWLYRPSQLGTPPYGCL